MSLVGCDILMIVLCPVVGAGINFAVRHFPFETLNLINDTTTNKFRSAKLGIVEKRGPVVKLSFVPTYL